jgi:hypothetical protein
MTTETITVECDEVPDVPMMVASDCNDFEQTFTECITETGCPSEYSILRHWSATDLCGNTSHVFQTINVEDTTAPELSNYPQDMETGCPLNLESAMITATDNCDGEVDVTFTEQTLSPNGEENYTGECMTGEQIIRTWTAQDCAGNSTTHTQVITVVEAELPGLAPEGTQSLNTFNVTSSEGGEFVLYFRLYFDGQTAIDLVDIYGHRIARIYDGNVEGETDYVVRYPKEGLAQGIYLFRLSQYNLELSDVELVVR